MQSITLDWTNPSEDDFDLVRIKVADTNAQPTTHKFEVRSDSFVHDIGAYSTTKYYWLAPVDRTGNVGNYVSGGSATTGSIDYSDVGNTPNIPEVATTAYLTLGDNNAPTDAEFNTAVGRDPIENDFVVVNKEFAFNYNGTAWVAVTEFIDGSLLVSGSLSASDITTGTLNANDVTISNLTVAYDTQVTGTPDLSEFITGGDVNANVTSISGGVIQTGTAVTVGTSNNVAILSGADADYRIWAGNVSPSLASFSVTKEGVVNATGAVIDGNITADSLDVENATITGTLTAPIGWSNSVYNGVINRGNLSESVKDLIDERIAEVSGGISGDFGQDDGSFNFDSQLDDDPQVNNITHESGKNITIELSGSRSWNRTFIGLPVVDMGVSISIQRSLAGANSWSTIATITDTGSSITTSTYLVHSGTQGYSISIYHTIAQDPASGNYDYRAITNGRGSAYNVSIPLQLTVVEPATIGAGNADTLDNQDGTYYLDYNNFTNTPSTANWDTAYGWGNHSTQNYAVTTGDTFTGSIESSKNMVTTSGNGVFNVSKTLLGNVHFANGNGANGSPKQSGITWQGSSATQAQAGIYVVNDDSSGTHMALATTNSYSTGPQVGLSINNSGVVDFPRSRPTYGGNGLWSSGDFSASQITNWDTAYTYSQVGHLPLTGGTISGTVSLVSTNDAQLYLNGNGSTWAGIAWTDGGGTDYTWYRGENSTFSIGGSGSNVSGKKLHINGGTTIGSSYSGTAVPTNGLYVEGDIKANSNLHQFNNSTDAHLGLFSANGARQRADSRDESTLARTHWYGVSDTGVTSNFRHAWYDGNSYVNVTAENDGVTFGGHLTSTGNMNVTGDLKMIGTDSYIWSPNTSTGFTGLWDPYNSRSVWRYDNNLDSIYLQRFVNIGDTASTNSGSWNARLNVTGSQHAKIDVTSASDSITTAIYSHTGQDSGKMGTTSAHKLGLISGGTAHWYLETSGEFRHKDQSPTGLGAGGIRSANNIDVGNVTNGAFRIYDGSSFRGGHGTSRWGFGTGYATDSMCAYSVGTNYYISTDSGVIRGNFSASGISAETGGFLINGSTVIDSSKNLYAKRPIFDSENSSDDSLVSRWRYGSDDAYQLNIHQRVTSGVVRWSFGQVNASTTYSDLFVLDRGRIGLGIQNPETQFHVYGAGNEPMYLQGTGGGVWMNIKSSTSNLWSVGADSSGWAIYDRTNSRYTLRSKNNGVLEIPTVSSGTLIASGISSDTMGYNPNRGVYIGGVGGKYLYSGNSATDYPTYYSGAVYEVWTTKAYQASSTGGGNNIAKYASNGYLYTNNWIHPANGSGLFYDSGTHFHDYGNGQMRLYGTGSSDPRFKFANQTAGDLGFVYASNSKEIGFANSAESWSLRCDNNKKTTFYGNLETGLTSSTTTLGYLLKLRSGSGEGGTIDLESANGSISHGDVRNLGNHCMIHKYTFAGGYGYGQYAENWWDGDSYHKIQIIGGVFNFGGGITATGNITAYSDISLKDNIQIISDSLSKVAKLRGVTYDRTDLKNERHAGVIAQEVEQVLPEVVTTDQDGIKSVAYGNMVGLLIEAIKELKQEIEALKNGNN